MLQEGKEVTHMIQTKSNFLKQVVLCVWIGLTVFVWLAVNISESRISRAPLIISQLMTKTREIVWPYIYRQYIFAEDPKERK
jgi:hypothetical protein